MGHHYIKKSAFFSRSELLDNGENVISLLHLGKDIHTVKQLKIYYDFHKMISEGRWCARQCEGCPYPKYRTLCNIFRNQDALYHWKITKPLAVYGLTTPSTVTISLEAIVHLLSVADRTTDAIRLIMARYRHSGLDIKPVKPHYQKQSVYFAMYTSEWDELRELKGNMTLPCIIDAIILADARGEFS